MPKHAVEVVTYEINPPAQEMQEVPTDSQDWGDANKAKNPNDASVPSKRSPPTESTKSPEVKQNHPDLGLPNQGVPKHAVEEVINENNPPAQELQEVPTLRTDSTCEPSTKGSILEHQMVEDNNPMGGVSAEPGNDPTREVVPKRQDASDEDFVRGVC